jgi:hypothetical protein
VANPSPKTKHLQETQWRPGESGNPRGRAVGSKNISTWVQDLLFDESFNCLVSPQESIRFDGPPIKAIIATGIIRASKGDVKWADFLFKYARDEEVTFKETFAEVVSRQKQEYGL